MSGVQTHITKPLCPTKTKKVFDQFFVETQCDPFIVLAANSYHA